MSNPRMIPSICVLAALVFVACGNNGTSNGTNNGANNGVNNGANNGVNNGGDGDMGHPDDQGGEDSGRRDTGGDETDTGGDETDTGATDTGTDDMALPGLRETEPNDGTTVDEVNVLGLDETIGGTVAVDDSDVFHLVTTTPGAIYEFTIELPAGSALQPHLAVFDDGRSGDPPADDYVKISRDGKLRLLAMGVGGYFVAVRDARAVDGGAAGGADHTYELTITEHLATTAVQGQADFSLAFDGALAYPADVHLWTFQGTAGDDVVFDMLGGPNIDGRLFVFAESTGDWIARQDDRAAGDPNPFLDAPLTESGAMYLVVENIAEDAANLSYAINASRN